MFNEQITDHCIMINKTAITMYVKYNASSFSAFYDRIAVSCEFDLLAKLCYWEV